LIDEKLRLACEEAALSHGLNVPMIHIVPHQEMRISSDGDTLYLASELAEMPNVALLALISFALYFHTHVGVHRRMIAQGPRSFGQKLATLVVGFGSAPRKFDYALGPVAREEAKASYKGSHVALLQALLMSRSGLVSNDESLFAESFLGDSLFEDGEQVAEFARHLESLIEGDFPDAREQHLQAPNKLLKLAHRTSKLLEAGDPNSSKQVASLNRLYLSIGPVGSLAFIISRLANTTLSDDERIQVLLELLVSVEPLQVRLQLVDFAASQWLALSNTQRLSLIAKLREALSKMPSIESPILTWTLLSVLRSKLNLDETEIVKLKPLNDKAKRRCIGELFFTAAELGGEASPISARALRDQVDAVCESLDIDRPVTSPDEFQAAAWLEALDDLSRFTLHETLCVLDALTLWGQENIMYQTWLDAICQRLKVQRQFSTPLKTQSTHQTVLAEPMHEASPFNPKDL
jgi:hypothetical protein